MPFGQRRQELGQTLGVGLGVSGNRRAFANPRRPDVGGAIRIRVQQHGVGAALDQSRGKGGRQEGLSTTALARGDGHYRHDGKQYTGKAGNR